LAGNAEDLTQGIPNEKARNPKQARMTEYDLKKQSQFTTCQNERKINDNIEILAIWQCNKPYKGRFSAQEPVLLYGDRYCEEYFSGFPILPNLTKVFSYCPPILILPVK